MCYLLRAQGIPARVAIGYRAPAERRGQRAALMGYNTDGHAWAEMYLDGIGWVVAEGGTKGRIPPPDPVPDPKELDHYLAAIGEVPAEVFADDSKSTSFLRLTPARAAALVPLTLLGLFALKWWMLFLAPLLVSTSRLPRVAYRSVLVRLAEVGLRREYGETWDDFAERVAKVAPEFERMTGAHLRAAFGSGSSLEREEWFDLSRKTAAHLAEKFPAGRRWRGKLNPLTWFGI
jgi:hypothetical protein